MSTFLLQLALTVESPKKLDTSPMSVRAIDELTAEIERRSNRAYEKYAAEPRTIEARALLRDTKGPQE